MNDTYQTSLIERLADGEYACEYFNAALGDFDADSKDLGHEIAFLTNALDNLIGAFSDKAVENQSPRSEIYFVFDILSPRGLYFIGLTTIMMPYHISKGHLSFLRRLAKRKRSLPKLATYGLHRSTYKLKKKEKERQFAQQLRDVAEFNSVGKAHNTAYA